MKNVYDKLDAECSKTIEHFKNDLSKLRTGRASAKLLDGIMVDYYGSQTPLNQLGVVNSPEARLLTIQVYDVSAIDAIEKAIKVADLGLNPARDGNLIRIPVPALTEERRKEIVKSLGKIAEDNKVSVRNHRRIAIDEIKKLKDDKSISEDDQKKSTDEIQKIVDKHTKKIDELAKEKEKEVMTV